MKMEAKWAEWHFVNLPTDDSKSSRMQNTD